MAMLNLGMGLRAGAPQSTPPVQPVSASLSRLSFSCTESVAGSTLRLSTASVAVANTQTLPSSSVIYCGRGDKKTAKGKRFNHSFGNARPRDKKKGRGPPRAPMPPSPPKKDRFNDGEIVKIEIDESFFN